MMIRLLILAVAIQWNSYAQIATRFGTTVTKRTSTSVSPNIQTPTYSLTLSFHGDSITRDLERTNYCFTVCSNMMSVLHLVPQFNQRGINGISYAYRWPSEPYTATMIVDAPIAIDPVRQTGKTNWLVVFAGTNGLTLAGHSAATEYSDFKTYIAARIADGFIGNQIVVVTCLPRTGLNNTTRATFNTSLVGDDGGYGYRLARVDQNTDIGENGDDLNTTYYYDGTHPTEAGHAIIAQVVYAAMYP